MSSAGSTPSGLVEPVHIGKRAQPTTKEESGGHGGDDDHVGVFTEEVKRPAETAVFGHVASNQFGLGFGKIEGGAVGFGDGGDEIDEEGHGGEEDEPDVVVGLGVDNGTDFQCTGEKQRGDDGEAASGFVADELGGAANGADDGIVTVGGPTAEDDAEKAERADANDEENADVDALGYAKAGTKVERAHGGERGNHRDDGGEPEDEGIRIARDDVFLDEELDSVGNGLEQTVGANAHGAEASLHVGHELAFDEDDVAGDERDDGDDDNTTDEFDPPGLEELEDWIHGRSSPGEEVASGERREAREESEQPKNPGATTAPGAPSAPIALGRSGRRGKSGGKPPHSTRIIGPPRLGRYRGCQ